MNRSQKEFIDNVKRQIAEGKPCGEEGYLFKAAQMLVDLMPDLCLLEESGALCDAPEVFVFELEDGIIGLQGTRNDFAYTCAEDGTPFFVSGEGRTLARQQARLNAAYLRNAVNFRTKLNEVLDNANR